MSNILSRIFILLFSLPILVFSQENQEYLSITSGWGSYVFVGTSSGVYRLEHDSIWNWNKEILVQSPEDSSIFVNSKFVDLQKWENAIYAIGHYNGESSIYYIHEDSSSWQSVYTTENELTHIILGPNNTMFASGKKGLIIKSTNAGGQEWITLKSSIQEDITSIVYAWDKLMVCADSSLLISEVPLNSFDYEKDSLEWSSEEIKLIQITSIGYQELLGFDGINLLKGFGNNWKQNFLINLNEQVTTFDNNFLGTKAGLYRISGPWHHNNHYGELIKNSTTSNIVDVNGGYALDDMGKIYSWAEYSEVNPYVGFDSPNGSCNNDLVAFKNKGKRDYNYQWLVNDSLVSENYDYNHVFENVGTYKITLIATIEDSSTSSEVSISFQVTEKPNDINYYAIDSVLCHQGNTSILINNTTSDYNYVLQSLDNSIAVDSEIGNGGTLALHTGLITDSTYYQVLQKSIMNDCEIKHNDTILIAVEQTKAHFATTLVNAAINEKMVVINRSSQSSFYKWSGSPDAIFSNHESREPQVSFTSITDSTSLKLVATSLFGCSDTTEIAGPLVYDPETIDKNCWAMSFDGGQYELPNEYTNNCDAIAIDGNGNILIGGSYYDNSFSSMGQTRSIRLNSRGPYLAKYSNMGVLKWIVHGSNSSITDNPRLGNIVVDGNQNIYFHNNSWFFEFLDNSDSLISIREKYLFKLDSTGQVVWTKYYPDKIDNLSLGPDGNLYFTQHRYQNRLEIHKVSSAGESIWAFNVQTSSNPVQISDIEFDLAGNFYITGTSLYMAFQDIDGTILTYNNPSYNGESAFIVKYDSSGHIKWYNAISSVGEVTGLNIAVSRYGDVFSQMWSDGEELIVPSQNEEVDTAKVEGIVIVAYDHQGNKRWITGHGTGRNRPNSFTLDTNGYIYSAGEGLGPTKFLSTDYTETTIDFPSFPKGNIYISKYDDYGQLEWVRTAQGDRFNDALNTRGSANRLLIDEFDNIVVAGNLTTSSGTVEYPIADTSVTISGTDIFISRFDPSVCNDYNNILIELPAEKLCLDTEISFPFRAKNDIQINENNYYILQLLKSDETGTTMSNIDSIQSTELSDKIVTSITDIEESASYSIRIKSTSPELFSEQVKIQFGELPAGTIQTFDICKNDWLEIRATKGLSYNWEPNYNLEMAANFAIVSPEVNTTYVAEINHLCGVVYDTFEVRVNSSNITELDVLNICEGDEILIFDKNVTEAGIYYDSIQNRFGCDSIIVQSLEVWPVYDTILSNVEICQGEIFDFYGQSINESGVYQHILTSEHGCDSIIVQEIIINNSYYNIIDHIALCEGDSALIFGDFQTEAGIYEDNHYAENGCDSIVAIELIVSDIDFTMLQDENSITVAEEPQSSVFYQWLDCDFHLLPISQQTNQIFYFEEPGNYAVRINKNGCVDTSHCVNNVITNLDNLSNFISIYPNPNKGIFTVDVFDNSSIHITNITGQVVYEQKLSQGKSIIYLDLPTGTYYLRVSTDDYTESKKIQIFK